MFSRTKQRCVPWIALRSHSSITTAWERDINPWRRLTDWVRVNSPKPHRFRRVSEVVKPRSCKRCLNRWIDHDLLLKTMQIMSSSNYCSSTSLIEEILWGLIEIATWVKTWNNVQLTSVISVGGKLVPYLVRKLLSNLSTKNSQFFKV